jgi:hypothetical protein
MVDREHPATDDEAREGDHPVGRRPYGLAWPGRDVDAAMTRRVFGGGCLICANDRVRRPERPAPPWRRPRDRGIADRRRNHRRRHADRQEEREEDRGGPRKQSHDGHHVKATLSPAPDPPFVGGACQDRWC